MSNTFGDIVRLTIFGESHGPSIGAVLDGLPPGTAIDWAQVRTEMARRAPGRNPLSTARSESDDVEIQSGFFNGRTTGTPLCAIIRNTDARSGDYDLLRHVMRPGHADYTGHERYGGCNDYRGGGHFSGRLTAPLVFAGAIALQLLEQRGVTIGSHILQIESVMDRPFNPQGEAPERLRELRRRTLPLIEPQQEEIMEQTIGRARADQDSVGGTVECMAVGLPAGLGNPFFDSVESRLSHMLFSIPAVKGVEFGDGFSLAYMRGSTANDELHYHEGQIETRTNHNGGINGGITNGMPLLFRLVVKPTPSIARRQRTVDLDTKQDCLIEIKGRHDPCIVQRAIPVIEAAAAWTLLDIWLATETERCGDGTR